MELLFKLLKRTEKKKTLADYQREMLVKQGRDQFKKLMDRGLGIPVAVG